MQSLSLFIIWAIEFLAQNDNTILTVNIAAVLLGYIISSIFYHTSLLKEEWLKLLSYSLFTLTFMYVSYLAFGKPHGYFIFCLGSTLSNVFMISASCALLNKQQAYPNWFSQTKNHALSHTPPLILLIATFTFILAGIETYMYKNTTWSAFVRVPDAILSAGSVYYFGHALFKKLHPSGSHFSYPTWMSKCSPLFAYTIFILMLIYSLVNLLFGIPWILHHFLPGVYDIEMIKTLIDPLIITGALFGKFGMFLGTFTLMLQGISLVSPKLTADLLDKVGRSRKEYLSGEGVIESIGLTLNASCVDVYYFRPNLKSKRILHAGWSRADGSISKSPASLTNVSKSLDLTLRSGKVQDSENTLTLPIYFQGGIVGAMCIHWPQPKTCSPDFTKRMCLIADFLGPAINSQRTLLALNNIETQFQKLEIDAQSMSYDDLITAHIKVLSAELDAHIIGFDMDTGFTTYQTVIGPQGKVINLDPQRIENLPQGITLVQDTVARQFEKTEVKMAIIDWPVRVQDVRIGTIWVASPKDSDLPSHPTLLNDWALANIVTTLLADAVFDAVRIFSSKALERCGQALNAEETKSRIDWFGIIKQSCKESGFLSCSASLDGGKLILGAAHNPDQGAAHNPDHFDKQYQLHKKIGPIEAYLSNKPGNHPMIKLIISQDNHLLLATPNPDFRKELNNNWPWLMFLERLVRVSQAALDRLETRQMKADALDFQSFSTATLTIGSLIHQLGNQVNNLASATNIFEDAYKSGELVVPQHLTKPMKLTHLAIINLKQTIATILDAAKYDTSRPCLLTDAMKQIENLFADALYYNDIKLNIKINGNQQIDLPQSVVTLAVSNLVSNSIDALRKAKTHDACIQIVAEQADGNFLCSVIDNGPGIPAELQKRIFDLNVSTKEGSHGIGLYMTHRALLENKGRVWLESSQPGRTQIDISFPLAI